MKRFVAVILALFSMLMGGSLLAAPANNNFTNAIVIASQSNVSVTGSNVSATTEPNEPIHNQEHPEFPGGKSVWWKWTAPTTDYYTFTTAGSAFDTVIAVYTGTALTDLVSQGSNDDAPNTTDGTSRLDLNVVSGTTYYIAVDGFGDTAATTASGSIVLSIHPDTSINDDFANRLTLSGAHAYAVGSTADATKEASEPNHASNAGGKSIWWTWTAPASGSVTITTRGSDFDTLLGVYTGSFVDALANVAGNDDDASIVDGNVHASTVTFNAVSGTQYQIAVDGFFDGDTVANGNVVLSVGMNDTPGTFGTLVPLNGGSWQVTVTGPVASRYALQFSPDLANWFPATTMILGTNGVANYTDAEVGDDTMRFYRLVQP